VAPEWRVFIMAAIGLFAATIAASLARTKQAVGGMAGRYLCRRLVNGKRCTFVCTSGAGLASHERTHLADTAPARRAGGDADSERASLSVLRVPSHQLTAHELGWGDSDNHGYDDMSSGAMYAGESFLGRRSDGEKPALAREERAVSERSPPERRPRAVSSGSGDGELDAVEELPQSTRRRTDGEYALELDAAGSTTDTGDTQVAASEGGLGERGQLHEQPFHWLGATAAPALLVHPGAPAAATPAPTDSMPTDPVLPHNVQVGAQPVRVGLDQYALPPVARSTPFPVFQQDLAHWLLENAVSERGADSLLRLLRASQPGEANELPANGRTFFSRLSAHTAAEDVVPLQVIPVPLQGLSKPAEMAHFDVWQVLMIKFVLNPERAPHLHWDFQLKIGPDQQRIYEEMWTGNWWREASLAYPNCSILAVLMHIDDTPIGSSGVTPVYVTVGNLPFRKRRLDGAMEPVAYIPVLSGTETERATEAFRQRRRAYLHDALRVVFAPLIAAAQQGGVYVVVAGRRRRVVPLLAAFIADNDEKGRLALCYNKYNSAQPCCACLVEQRHLGDAEYTSTVPAPRRTIEIAKGLRQRYTAMAAAGARQGGPGEGQQQRWGTASRLRALEAECSMHLDVDNATWLLPSCDVYQSMPTDRLHDWDLGIVRAVVTTLLLLLRAQGRGGDAVQRLDKRLQALTTPPIPHLKRFGDAGLTGLQRVEGAHYRTLLQILPLALSDLDPCVHPDLLALVVDLHGLYETLRADHITEMALVAWQRRAATWATAFRRLLAIPFMGSEGSFVKLHMALGGHTVDAVRRYGILHNYDTAPYEKTHCLHVKSHQFNIARAGPLVIQLARRQQRKSMAAAMVARHHRDRDSDDDHDSPHAAADAEDALVGPAAGRSGSPVSKVVRDATYGSKGMLTWEVLSVAHAIPRATMVQLIAAAIPEHAADPSHTLVEVFVRTRIGADGTGDVIHANSHGLTARSSTEQMAAAAGSEPSRSSQVGRALGSGGVAGRVGRCDHVELVDSTLSVPTLMHVRCILRPMGLLSTGTTRTPSGVQVAPAFLLGRRLDTRPMTHCGQDWSGGRALLATDAAWMLVPATRAARRAAVCTMWAHPDGQPMPEGTRLVNLFVFQRDPSLGDSADGDEA
jgi:hypothetical protein